MNGLRLWSVLFAGSLFASLSSHALAAQTNRNALSQQEADDCKAAGIGEAFCKTLEDFVDPPADGITALSFSVKYDSSLYVFDAADSGPLGAFSVGGDTPPTDPGVGTQPVELLPATGYSPGAPLPGSTLSYTNVGGVVTVNYGPFDPVATPEDVDAFVLSFNFVNPITIDLAKSSVTYYANSPGADFTLLSSSCSPVMCGSNNPAMGITNNFSSGVPEPATWAMMVFGFALTGGFIRSFRGTDQPRRAVQSVMS